MSTVSEKISLVALCKSTLIAIFLCLAAVSVCHATELTPLDDVNPDSDAEDCPCGRVCDEWGNCDGCNACGDWGESGSGGGGGIQFPRASGNSNTGPKSHPGH